MDLENIIQNIILSEVSDRKRQTPYNITCKQNQKNNTNDPIYKIEANLKR